MRCQEIQRLSITPSLAAIGILLANTALADQPKPAPITAHQMAHCMLQRIHEDRRGDRNESYKEAFHACKQDLNAEADRGTATAMNNDREESK
jgi:hypothetical protein